MKTSLKKRQGTWYQIQVVGKTKEDKEVKVLAKTSGMKEKENLK